jgi:hypothetical protein
VPQDAAVPTRRRRFRRALEVTGVARRKKRLSVLREVGVVGGRDGISGMLALYLFWKIVRTPGDL